MRRGIRHAKARDKAANLGTYRCLNCETDASRVLALIADSFANNNVPCYFVIIEAREGGPCESNRYYEPFLRGETNGPPGSALSESDDR